MSEPGTCYCKTFNKKGTTVCIAIVAGDSKVPLKYNRLQQAR